MVRLLPHFILIYVIGWIVILCCYQRTRLFPFYMLKVLWTGFTVLAFLWVVAMSGGQSKEYIQRPTGPMAIFVGEIETESGVATLGGGYPGVLHQWTGTTPWWVVAFLLVAWASWGIFRRDDGRIHSKHVGILFIGHLVLGMFLYYGAGWKDCAAYLICMAVNDVLMLARPSLYMRRGQWLLLMYLLITLTPLVPPIVKFDWSRYSYFADNYRTAWTEGHIGQYFINSLIVTITSVSLTLLVGAMAAYVIARKHFAGRKILYGLIILGNAIPAILIQVPLFLVIKDWQFEFHGYHYSFMDSRLGLAIIYTAVSLPFTIFIMTGFFKTLPGSLEEAAAIDGCGQFETFKSIYLPLGMPGIATTGIFSFLYVWSEFNLGMIFMSNPNFKTLPIGLYDLSTATQFSAAWATLFAGIVLLCLPTFLIFVFLQEKIVAGLMAGSIKG